MRQQKALSETTSLSDRCWGLESSLIDRIEAIAEGRAVSAEASDRQAASAARRERHRRRILAMYGPTAFQTGCPTVARGLEARQAIGNLARRAGRFDSLLLLAVASGVSPATIAERLLMSPAAIRQRVSRTRRANDHLRPDEAA
ncbi:hypothetical protein ACLJK8_21775 [Amaricoccus sp. W119]